MSLTKAAFNDSTVAGDNTDEKNLELFRRHKVFSDVEVRSRCEILLDNYVKVLHIEALTMIDMTSKDLLPAMSRYSRTLCETILKRKAALANVSCPYEEETARHLGELIDSTYRYLTELKRLVFAADADTDTLESAMYYKDTVLPCMESLRAVVDEAETITAKEYWPYPSYGDMLFSIK